MEKTDIDKMIMFLEKIKSCKDVRSIIIGYHVGDGYGDIYGGSIVDVVFLVEHIKQMIFKENETTKVISVTEEKKR